MSTILLACCLGIGLLVGGMLPVYAGDLLSHEIELTVTLSGNVPPISDNLARFIVAAREASPLSLAAYDITPRIINGRQVSHLVGFNNTDIGEGVGNGTEAPVAFSFAFTPFSCISSAILTLILTPEHPLITTDVLMIINKPQGLNLFNAGGMYLVYGNDFLRGLPVGQTSTVSFDLKNIEVNTFFLDEDGLTIVNPIARIDLTPFLLDGSLDVIYAEDATIHKATLTITGIPSPARSPLGLPQTSGLTCS
jgi:hypothetical protein